MPALNYVTKEIISKTRACPKPHHRDIIIIINSNPGVIDDPNPNFKMITPYK
jgi:hypothetical protein